MIRKIFYKTRTIRWAIRKYFRAKSVIETKIAPFIPATLLRFPRYKAKLFRVHKLPRDEDSNIVSRIWLRYRYFTYFCYGCYQFNSPMRHERFYIYYHTYTWRMKRYIVFPLKYLLNSLIDLHSRYRRAQELEPRLKRNESDSMTRQHIESEMVFPREIWLEIAQYDVDILPLMFVNRALLDIFAPFIYDELHCILVISSLEKMWASDECFLRNGPDVRDSGIDGYEIYLRNKESRKYAYEALDISYNGAKYDKGLYTFWENRVEDWQTIGGAPIPSVNYSLDRRSTVVSNYSGLKCIISQIIKNPNSIMKKYLGKFSIDLMILSDVDKFREEFDRAIGKPMKDLVCYGLFAENPKEAVRLFCGYDEFTDRRIRMRYKMKKDLEQRSARLFRRQNALNIEAVKQKFNTVYHKELFAVAQLFESLFKPTMDEVDRGTFGFRNSRAFENVYFAFWNMGTIIDDEELDLRAQEDASQQSRDATDFAASTLRIKNRTFMCQDEVDNICRVIGELSTTKPDNGHSIYNFLVHGLRYSQNTEFSQQPDGPTGNIYLDYCYACPKTILLTNTKLS